MAGTKPRRSWLLIVSLCLNVALVAAVAVVAWRVAHFDIWSMPAARSRRARSWPRFPDRRPAIQAIIDTHRGRIAALRRGTARARYDAFRVFGAPDYTPEKMATALDGVVAADGALERDVVRRLGCKPRDAVARRAPGAGPRMSKPATAPGSTACGGGTGCSKYAPPSRGG